LDNIRKRSKSLSEEQVEGLVATYDGGVRHVDAVLEELIEGWRADGLLDNAILIITSDHGESLGQRYGRIKGHGKMFEDGLHVPLIVRFPDGFRAGEREAGRVSLVDIVPTVLEAAGLELDARLPGVSLRQTPSPERLIMASRPPSRAYYSGPWKVVTFDKDPSMLFNLDEDPLELDAPKHAGRAEGMGLELEAAIQARWASRPAFDAPAIPAGAYEKQMRAQLDALGYAGD
ncbi:MAG: arylsulfatase A-like enzyme, partial [Planctomycetota bacterium]